MALLGSTIVSKGGNVLLGAINYLTMRHKERDVVGLRLLLCPLDSNVVLRTACCSVGVALPVYSTCRAIERKIPDEQEKWLLYWTAYGSFCLVEVFSDKLLSWFPLYYHVKFAFLVWLQLPTVEGARQLYTSYLRPLCLRHQAKVDQIVDVAYGEMLEVISSHEKEIRFAKAVFTKTIALGNRTLRRALDGIRQPQLPLLPNAIVVANGNDSGYDSDSGSRFNSAADDE